MAARLRKKLGNGKNSHGRSAALDANAAWDAVCDMKGPAGFYAYDRSAGGVAIPAELGDNDEDASVQAIPYEKLRLRTLPDAKFLTKRKMMMAWGPGLAKKRRS